MPRSSRIKSHKQSKYSSREYSDLDDDVKMEVRNDDKENGVSNKVSKDSVLSGEKRKLGKDLSGVHANVNVSDEYLTPSKRRKEKIHGGSNRWNAEVVNIDDQNLKSMNLLKVAGESKSKTSGKLDVDSESKRCDKELGRKEGRQIKDYKETKDNDQSSKRGREHNEWPIDERLRNIELEKELEKRMQKREGNSDNDIKQKDEVYVERVSKSRDDKRRRESEKNNKHKDGERYRKREDKYRENGYKYKHKEERHREDVGIHHRHKKGKPNDDSDAASPHYRGGSPIYDDRVARHKDNKDMKRDNDKDEKRSMSEATVDLVSEKGRPKSHNDIELTVNHSRHRSSPSGKFNPSRDHQRVSKQEETKYRDYINEDRTRSLEKITQKDDNCIDKISPLDTDSLSVLSPFTKSGHFSGNHKSLLPPQLPFRTGLDSPLGFGSSEDDKSKSNNRNLRSGDPNMGRPQNNWNNFPNWPSSTLAANGGYIPFHHHLPPPMFNPVMQQFVSPMFVRPPMNVNHMPYHVHDGDVFSGHAHGHAHPVTFSDGSHIYGGTQSNNQMWELSVHMQSAAQKTDRSVDEPIDEILSGQSGQHIENEQNKLDFNTLEVMKVTESSHISVVAKEDDDTLISRAYLSKIDISEDLTQPELYEQCTSMLDLDQALVSDEFDCKILYLEEGLEADISNSASLFSAVDDSVFKKAVSLYTKQKVHFVATNQEGVLNDTGSVSASDPEKSDQVNDEPLIQKLDMDPVNLDKESCAPSVGGCDVKVKLKDSVLSNNVLTTELIELESVNLSRIHPENTH